MAWMSGMSPLTDALLFTHCGDHGLNLYFESTSLVGQRSTIAAGNKTDKEGNVGAETPRLMTKPTRGPMAFLLQRMIIVASGAACRQVAGIGH